MKTNPNLKKKKQSDRVKGCLKLCIRILHLMDRFSYPNLSDQTNGQGPHSSTKILERTVRRKYGSRFRMYSIFYIEHIVSQSLYRSMWTRRTPRGVRVDLDRGRRMYCLRDYDLLCLQPNACRREFSVLSCSQNC